MAIGFLACCKSWGLAEDMASILLICSSSLLLNIRYPFLLGQAVLLAKFSDEKLNTGPFQSPALSHSPPKKVFPCVHFRTFKPFNFIRYFYHRVMTSAYHLKPFELEVLVAIVGYLKKGDFSFSVAMIFK